MTMRVGSFGFGLEIPVSGISSGDDLSLRVIFERPDGTTFERTTTDDQIDITDDHTLLTVAILDGDLTVTGVYHYQVWDVTADAMIRSDIDAFFIEGSLALV